MKCRNCGADTDNKLICPICGTKNIGMRKCHVCETTILPGMRQCPNCGTPFHVEKNEFDHIPQVHQPHIKTKHKTEFQMPDFSGFKKTKKEAYRKPKKHLNYVSIIAFTLASVAIVCIAALNIFLPMIPDDESYQEEAVITDIIDTTYQNSYNHNFNKEGRAYAGLDTLWVNSQSMENTIAYVIPDGSVQEIEEQYKYFYAYDDDMYCYDFVNKEYKNLYSDETLVGDVAQVYHDHDDIIYRTLNNDLYWLTGDGMHRFLLGNVEDFIVDDENDMILVQSNGKVSAYDYVGNKIQENFEFSSLKDSKAYFDHGKLYYMEDEFIRVYQDEAYSTIYTVLDYTPDDFYVCNEGIYFREDDSLYLYNEVEDEYEWITDYAEEFYGLNDGVVYYDYEEESIIYYNNYTYEYIY